MLNESLASECTKKLLKEINAKRLNNQCSLEEVACGIMNGHFEVEIDEYFTALKLDVIEEIRILLKDE